MIDRRRLPVRAGPECPICGDPDPCDLCVERAYDDYYDWLESVEREREADRLADAEAGR